MASADTTIKVHVESIIHDTIRDALQRISDTTGIRVNNIHVRRWLDISTLASPQFTPCDILIDSETSGPTKCK